MDESLPPEALERQEIFVHDDYGQDGDFEKIKELVVSTQFSLWTYKVVDIRFYTNHVSVGLPNNNRFVIRLVKEPCVIQDLRVNKERYRQLYCMKQKEPQKWSEFLAEEEKKRCLTISEVNEEAVQLCQRIVQESKDSINTIAFKHVYYTDPAHSDLFQRILSAAELKPTTLELALHAEEDQWLANFVEPDIVHTMPMEMLRSISSNLKQISGISKYAMSIFWEPIAVEECHVHFSAFWSQHFPNKIKMKAKKLIVSDAEEYYINETLIEVMAIEQLVFEFSDREFEPALSLTPLDTVLHRLTLIEPNASIAKIGEYESYGTYITQQLPNIKVVNIDLTINAKPVDLQKYGRNSLEKFKKCLEAMPSNTQSTANVDITLTEETNLDDVAKLLECMLSEDKISCSTTIPVGDNKNIIVKVQTKK
ncbi:unnamed protein product [Bursaphelenchus okinawaensis]|uniref:Uncharacterized protein n=1 Tax=Bursaphelenchus okinawaensis TaxID=465554 RepID=A0A811JRK8_9BILA|nr:unnamed protein product [Bursaphelenchus okinawaensis]CAG9080024.1 unnamed protein product [Bursaphelenchus okinawaensis]